MTLKCGVAECELVFPDGLGLMGYGPVSGAGHNPTLDPDPSTPRLWARAMVLQDGDRRVYLGFVDLWAGSPRITRMVVHRLASGDDPYDSDLAYVGGARSRRPRQGQGSQQQPDPFVKAHNLLVMPTHTHSAPGHYTGNRIYDVILQWPAGYRHDIAEIIVDALVTAFREASRKMHAATLTVRAGNAYGLGRNRSIEAFLANFKKDEQVVWPPPALVAQGRAAPSDIEQACVDPRFWVVAAFATEGGKDGKRGGLIGTFAVVGVHNAALGRDYRTYHPDWAGFAVADLKQSRFAKLQWHDSGNEWAAFAQGPAGDVTSIPVGSSMADMGPNLSRIIGYTLAERWSKVLEEARDSDVIETPVEVGFYRWRPRDDGLATWDIGMPVILGADESRTPFFFDPARGEARRAHASMRFAHRAIARVNAILRPDVAASEEGQMPKDPAFGAASLLLRKALQLDPGEEHPVHLLRLGKHYFFALPCEITTYASWHIERTLLERLGDQAVSASPLAMVNDYMGYVTTEREYCEQNYEGALNLYGKFTLRALTSAVVDTVKPPKVPSGSKDLDIDVKPPHDLPKPLPADDIDAMVTRLVRVLSWPARQILSRWVDRKDLE